MSRVAAARVFIRASRGRRVRMADRYTALFTLAVLAAVLGQPVSAALGGLSRQVGPTQAGAGLALVTLAFAGFLAAARAFGPVMVSAADAAWLLLSPLSRRGVLGRTAGVLLLVSVLAGAVLGLALVAALGSPDQLAGALVLGVAAGAGGMSLAVLAQTGQLWDVALRAGLVLLVVVAVLAAVGAVTRLPAPAAAWAAAVAAVLVRQAWAALDRIPARRLLTASARAGHLARAAVSLDPSVLTWIAEDNHWRGRKLRTRAWPALPASFAPAWQDWRRLARRPGRLALLGCSVAAPFLIARAGGGAAMVSLSVLAAAMAAAASAVSGARRDADNPGLARLLGVGPRAALAARSVLPALLAATWATAAFTLVSLAAGGSMAAVWFAPLVAPALAAGALRMARRAPVDHAMPVIDTPTGAIPTGPLIWGLTGLDLAIAGCLPAGYALLTQPAELGGLLVAQALAGAAALAGYVLGSNR